MILLRVFTTIKLLFTYVTFLKKKKFLSQEVELYYYTLPWYKNCRLFCSFFAQNLLLFLTSHTSKLLSLMAFFMYFAYVYFILSYFIDRVSKSHGLTVIWPRKNFLTLRKILKFAWANLRFMHFNPFFCFFLHALHILGNF